MDAPKASAALNQWMNKVETVKNTSNKSSEVRIPDFHVPQKPIILLSDLTFNQRLSMLSLHRPIIFFREIICFEHKLKDGYLNTRVARRFRTYPWLQTDP